MHSHDLCFTSQCTSCCVQQPDEEEDDEGPRTFLATAMDLAAELMKLRIISAVSDELAVVFYGAVGAHAQQGWWSAAARLLFACSYVWLQPSSM